MAISRGAFLKGASLTSLAGILAACSTGNSNSSSTSGSGSSASAEAGAFPVTISTQYGDVKLEKAPEKIAVVNAWKNADVLLSFGVVPVGAPKTTWGQNSNDSTDWFDAKLKDLGKSLNDITRYTETDGPDYTALSQLAPDAIFAPYGMMSQEIFDKLSKIAPVIAAPKGDNSYDSSWQHVTEQAGKMLGRPSDAKKIIEDTEKMIKDAAAKYSNLAGATFVAGYFNVADGTLGAYNSKDSRPQFFNDLGMTMAPYAKEAEAKDPSSTFLSFSSENLDKVDCDVLWAWVNDPAEIEQVKSNALLSKIPAVAKNATVFAQDKAQGLAMSAASPLSIEWLLKNSKLLEELSAAVKASKG